MVIVYAPRDTRLHTIILSYITHEYTYRHTRVKLVCIRVSVCAQDGWPRIMNEDECRPGHGFVTYVSYFNVNNEGPGRHIRRAAVTSVAFWKRSLYIYMCTQTRRRRCSSDDRWIFKKHFLRLVFFHLVCFFHSLSPSLWRLTRKNRTDV